MYLDGWHEVVYERKAREEEIEGVLVRGY